MAKAHPKHKEEFVKRGRPADDRNLRGLGTAGNDKWIIREAREDQFVFPTLNYSKQTSNLTEKRYLEETARLQGSKQGKRKILGNNEEASADDKMSKESKS